jgi:antitoxin CptB
VNRERAIPEDTRRLRWQCRRGLLELDLLLGRFVAERYVNLSAPEQEAFGLLLARPDQELLAWIQGQEVPPDELKGIISKILQ